MTTENSLEVSKEELEVAFDGPAYFTNRFYVTLAGATARIAFAEQGTPGALPRFRTAVTMSIGDYVELLNLIQRMANDLQTEMKGADGKPSAD